jgi:hypothetical protein
MDEQNRDMRFRCAVILCWLLVSIIARGQTGTISLGTLNTYWFFNGEEGKSDTDRPQAGHLLGLLPNEAPLFVGFQELGGGDDLAALAHSATARYGRPYQVLFVRGRDTSTGQNVGAILATSTGWGVYGRAHDSGIQHQG